MQLRGIDAKSESADYAVAQSALRTSGAKRLQDLIARIDGLSDIGELARAAAKA